MPNPRLNRDNMPADTFNNQTTDSNNYPSGIARAAANRKPGAAEAKRNWENEMERRQRQMQIRSMYTIEQALKEYGQWSQDEQRMPSVEDRRKWMQQFGITPPPYGDTQTERQQVLDALRAKKLELQNQLKDEWTRDPSIPPQWET